MRADLTTLYPKQHGENHFKWSDRLLSHSREHEINRQCSLGWHAECSDPAGESCQCLCHDPNAAEYTVEGHGEGREVVATRTEKGKLHWPPKDGEPETAWAHWVLALSEEDAAARAVAKQERIW